MKEIHKAKMTASMVMVTDGNGYPTSSSMISVTELNALNGWTNDGKGYIYPRLTSLEANSVKTNSSWGLPDYSAGVSMSTGDNVVPVDAVGYAYKGHYDQSSLRVTVDGQTVFRIIAGSSSVSSGGSFIIPKGSTVNIEGSCNGATYYPLIKE